MEKPALTLQQVWDSWKRDFKPWISKYYGNVAEIQFSADGWTQGVINPFIVTQLGPGLGCKVRILEKKMDALLFDATGKQWLLHLEHENYLRDVIGETQKLRNSKSHLKCIVSYGDSETSVEDNIEQTKKFVEEVLEPVIHAAIRSDTSQEWLFICGVNWKHFDSDSDWMGYRFQYNGRQPETVPLL